MTPSQTSTKEKPAAGSAANAGPRRYDNRLGVFGWLGGGRWGVERYLYTIHRITGLGILFYFLLHIVVTSSRVFGEDAWNSLVNGTLAQPVFLIGEYLVYAAFAFHALNGIRLALVELGFAVGRAEEPVYPYRSSLNVQRPLTVIVMILALILIAAGGYDFFAFGH